MNKFGQKLYVVPDSGFQLFFFPLMIEGDDDDSSLTSLSRSSADTPDGQKKLALIATINANRKEVGWSPGLKKQSGIDHYEKLGWNGCHSTQNPFVRYRLGPCRFDEKLTLLGLWLAVETNLGERENGWFFRADNPSPLHTEAMLNRNPYVAPSMHSLAEPKRFQVNCMGKLIEFNVKWTTPSAEDIDVDLILDFGNSRTCALILERQKSPGASGSSDRFAEICRPLPLRLPFLSDAPDFSVEDAMVSSRFVLKSPEFRALDCDAPGASNNPNALTAYVPRFALAPKGWKFWEKPKEHLDQVQLRVPHMFTKLSPVCLGDDVAEMVRGTSSVGKQFEGRIHKGQLMQQSSAKRFFWDDRRLDSAKHGDTWSMMPNFGDPAYLQEGNHEKIPLSGLMLRFQPADGAAWDIKQPPSLWGSGETVGEAQHRRPPNTCPVKPDYPRRNTLTWSILSIMETAQRYINSPNWTAGGQATRRRRIRTVVGSYPSGWSSTELSAYRAKWVEALNIFSLTQFPAGSPEVKLEMKLDESVASQLPLLYSCIKSFTSQSRGENWIQLNGVDRPGKMPVIRVMNLDIGGGTTDVSVVEYVDEEKGVDVDLRATVKFRDSYGEAGDGLLKLIIETILLEKLAGEGEKPDEAKESREMKRKARNSTFARFREVFEEVGVDAEGGTGRSNQQHRQAERTSVRIRWIVAVLIPLAIDLLKKRAAGEELKVGPESANIDKHNWSLFAKEFAISLRYGSDFTIKPEELDALVVKHFGLLIKRLAAIVAAFDVHMVFVCGKPSEQPAIRELVDRLLPIPLERIHFASGFRSGSWYPFRRRISLTGGKAGAKLDALTSDANERIDDAKTVTCVGAALARAIDAGLIPGWRLDISQQPGLSNHWGEITYDPEHGIPRSFLNKIVFSASGDTSAEVILGLGENRWIGRKMFESDSQRPEPVYKLRWIGDDADRPDKVKAVFRRIAATAECADALELVHATDREGKTDYSSRVRLQLEPVSETSWLDTGRLF